MDDEYDIVRPISFCEAINNEQFLDFALSHIAERNTDEIHPVADQIVVLYILNDWNNKGKERFTENEVQERYSELLADYVVTKLVNKDLVSVRFDEETGESLYSLTNKGKDQINNEC